MSSAAFQNALVLTGPTGSGKSAQAIALARQIDAEIIAMDSMTLYRGMDIGTAKPTIEERQGIPHHLMDVLEPWEASSAAWWLAEAEQCAHEIASRGKQVIIVGGTAFYLKALLFGLFAGPAGDTILREQLTREAQELGAAALHQRLAAVDAVTAARLHPNDVRRVVRALEVWQLTGRPISAWQQEWQRQPSQTPVCVWLDVPRAELYRRIDQRVEQMFALGLLEEVERLLRLPQPLSKEAGQAVGYKEVLAYLQGSATLEDTVELVKTRSRQLAKRQMTWFRHLPGCQPVYGELTRETWHRRMKEE